LRRQPTVDGAPPARAASARACCPTTHSREPPGAKVAPCASRLWRCPLNLFDRRSLFERPLASRALIDRPGSSEPRRARCTVFLDVGALPAPGQACSRILTDHAVQRAGEVGARPRRLRLCRRERRSAERASAWREDSNAVIPMFAIFHLRRCDGGREDIPLLAYHFLQKYGRTRGAKIQADQRRGGAALCSARTLARQRARGSRRRSSTRGGDGAGEAIVPPIPASAGRASGVPRRRRSGGAWLNTTCRGAPVLRLRIAWWFSFDQPMRRLLERLRQRQRGGAPLGMDRLNFRRLMKQRSSGKGDPRITWGG
jgi:hypothetical protein